MKKIKHRRVWGTLFTALLLCVTLVLVSLPIASEDATSEEEAETIDIVVLVEDVAQGAKIKSSSLELRTVKSWNAPKNAIYDTADVSGKYARVDLYAGEYVYKEQLSATSVAPNNSHLLVKPIVKSEERTVVVTDYIPANTGEDVTALLQDLINKNGGRAIYFPDGEYIISRPLKTSANASTTVSIFLSDGAVIKADPKTWKGESGGLDAMICMGAGDPENDVRSQGSYYTLQGGTIDCSGVADGISIDSGRESLIKNVLIKQSEVGVFVKTGANSGSSDIDFEDITIIGNGKPGSKGFYIVGFDNTFTNIKIYDTQYGIQLNSGGNTFRNIQCIYTHSDNINSRMPYAQTIGIYETGQGNFYYHCSVENYSTAYNLNGTMEIFDNCRAKWTANKVSDKSEKHIAFVTTSKFNSCFSNVRVEFFDATTDNIVFNAKDGGNGKFESPMITTELCSSQLAGGYVRHGIISLPTPTKQ